MSDTEARAGTIFYAHNMNVDGSDEQVHGMLERVRQVGAHALFVSEAYNPDKPSTRIENVAEDLGRLGLEVAYRRYSEVNRQDQHGYLAAASMSRGGQLRHIDLAGRGAVEMAMLDDFGQPMKVVGAHWNDGAKRRSMERQIFLRHYGPAIEHGKLVLMGDLNTNSNFWNWLVPVAAVAGPAIWAGVGLGLLHPAKPGMENPPVIGRAISIADRATHQLLGRDYLELRLAGLCEAGRPLPTALVPQLPPSLLRMLERVPMVDVIAWLHEPHQRLDHIMANYGSFDNATVYPRLPGDDHLGISARHLSNRHMLTAR